MTFSAIYPHTARGIIPVSLSMGLEHLKLTDHSLCFLVCIVCELGSAMMVSCRGASRPRNPLYSPIRPPAPANSDLFTVPSPNVAELESNSMSASQIDVFHLAACLELCPEPHRLHRKHPVPLARLHMAVIGQDSYSSPDGA